ncbi:hypothetical protein [Saccharothrix variisporea]|uniref:Uncharacterized protein n=1 Tax=Saccharothrix variisporea TaxID=543527 RepID=A0A495XTP2_9PSEU|nr:hypothetical protein [Saccharothrix variisporea]RKT75058.1 hypothetical protein DFJ66_8435 [Saccharothrix variisporea]
MTHSTANENHRLSFWASVRESAVPPPMIESATARRVVGDWAGACAAAHVDADLDLRTIHRLHGTQFARELRDDLRHLAPDLLRWHFPRIGPDGLVRPAVTVSLARYGRLHLVARTPPAWASAGQRISLALWDPARPRDGVGGHRHPHPDRRFRLDLHRHLWDVRKAAELRERTTGDPGAARLAAELDAEEHGLAVDRWAAEAALLLRADGCADRIVSVRLNTQRWLAFDGSSMVATSRGRAGPVLPDAATWVLPDLELLRAGLIDADRLHPLVASALVPDHQPAARSPDTAPSARLVQCRGATHRIGVVDGVPVALDHDPDEIRREELLTALGGPALPCLRVVDVLRQPESLVDVRARLAHSLYRAGITTFR